MSVTYNILFTTGGPGSVSGTITFDELAPFSATVTSYTISTSGTGSDSTFDESEGSEAAAFDGGGAVIGANITATDTVTGSDLELTGSLTFAFDGTDDTTSGTYVLQVVPEPSAALLIGAGLTALAARRRR